MLNPLRWLFSLFSFFFYTFLLGIILVGILFINLPNISQLKDHNPSSTRFMQLFVEKAEQAGSDSTITEQWVSFNQISPLLKRAILVSEDASFYSHHGFDWFEFRQALEKNFKKMAFARGGSTITQQLVKNLYLGPQKNPLRKLREWIITFQMEHTLSKQRIFEIYLNVVEWGPGIFGAEAASEYYFHKSANNLSSTEAATLAALLPNPIAYGQAIKEKPSSKLARKVNWRKNLILKRMTTYNEQAPATAFKTPTLADLEGIIADFKQRIFPEQTPTKTNKPSSVVDEDNDNDELPLDSSDNNEPYTDY